jgi:hypothetical protein
MLNQFRGFYAESHGEVLGSVELLPVPILDKPVDLLDQLLEKSVGHDFMPILVMVDRPESNGPLPEGARALAVCVAHALGPARIKADVATGRNVSRAN